MPDSTPATRQRGWRNRRWVRAATGLFVAFGLLNAVAWQHAWQFTHFATPGQPRPPDPTRLSKPARLALVVTGVTLPRPPARAVPAGYRAERLQLPNGAWLGLWTAPSTLATPARGTVMLLHGYGGEKGSLLPEAAFFRQIGYKVVLVDFRGGGSSSGNDVTIGYREADDVRAVCRWLRSEASGPVVLFGVSMGAVAALRAAAVYSADVQPAAMILECPFGSTYQTVENRFRALGVPPVPLAGLLTFWGGAQHGYWAFDHDPRRYAQAVTAPTLLVQGTADARVTVAEARAIYNNLPGPRELLLLPGAGHGHYSTSRPTAWRRAVTRQLAAFPRGRQPEIGAAR